LKEEKRRREKDEKEIQSLKGIKQKQNKNKTKTKQNKTIQKQTKPKQTKHQTKQTRTHIHFFLSFSSEKLRQLQQGKIAGRNPFEQQPVEPNEDSSSIPGWSSEFKLLMGVSSFGIILIIIVFFKLFGGKAKSLASAFGSNVKLTTAGRSGAKVA